MTNLTFNKAKHASWINEYSPETCKLNRAEYCNFISDYITEEHDGFVLNLNGAWGSGKTHFLRMLYANLLSNRYPVVYIDAWESDFSKEPLTVVASELLSQLNLLNSNIGKNIGPLKDLLGKVLKGTIYGVTGYVSNQVLADPSIGVEAAKTLLDDKTPSDFLNNIQKNHNEQIKAIQSIRIQLSNLAGTLKTSYSANIPVIVLVDELDRCRPTYAVELLEVVKHFFQTKNFVFIIASDTQQLEHSIQSVYGNKFESTKYLKRFFNREARLPVPDIKSYISTSDFNLKNYPTENIVLIPNIKNTNYVQNITNVLLSFKLEIRDIDQIISKIISCLRSASHIKVKTNKIQSVDIIILTVGIVEQHLKLDSFEKRTDNNMEPPSEMNSVILSKDFDSISMVNLGIANSSWHIDAEYNRPERMERNYLAMRAEELKSTEAQDYLHGYLAAINSRNTQVNKSWLWSDYKRIINLAGNLT